VPSRTNKKDRSSHPWYNALVYTRVDNAFQGMKNTCPTPGTKETGGTKENAHTYQRGNRDAMSRKKGYSDVGECCSGRVPGCDSKHPGAHREESVNESLSDEALPRLLNAPRLRGSGQSQGHSLGARERKQGGATDTAPSRAIMSGRPPAAALVLTALPPVEKCWLG
jgi:hypothetical protein